VAGTGWKALPANYELWYYYGVVFCGMCLKAKGRFGLRGKVHLQLPDFKLFSMSIMNKSVKYRDWKQKAIQQMRNVLNL